MQVDFVSLKIIEFSYSVQPKTSLSMLFDEVCPVFLAYHG